MKRILLPLRTRNFPVVGSLGSRTGLDFVHASLRPDLWRPRARRMNEDVAFEWWRCTASLGIAVLQGDCCSRVACRPPSAAASVNFFGRIGARRMIRFGFHRLNFSMVLLSPTLFALGPDSVLGDSRASRHLPPLLREMRDGYSRKAAHRFLSQ